MTDGGEQRADRTREWNAGCTGCADFFVKYKSLFKFFLPKNQYPMNLTSHQISCLSR